MNEQGLRRSEVSHLVGTTPLSVYFQTTHTQKENRKRNSASGLPFLHGVKLAVCYIKPLQISNKKIKGVLVAAYPAPNIIDRFRILRIELLANAIAPYCKLLDTKVQFNTENTKVV